LPGKLGFKLGLLRRFGILVSYLKLDWSGMVKPFYTILEGLFPFNGFGSLHYLSEIEVLKSSRGNSISKRNSAPGLRSGFIAGDRTILERYRGYRSYVGCASPLPLQRASAVCLGRF